jgi:hypothetical protein
LCFKFVVKFISTLKLVSIQILHNLYYFKPASLQTETSMLVDEKANWIMRTEFLYIFQNFSGLYITLFWDARSCNVVDIYQRFVWISASISRNKYKPRGIRVRDIAKWRQELGLLDPAHIRLSLCHFFPLAAFSSTLVSQVSWGGVRPSSLGTSPTNWAIVPAPDDRWWMWSSRWNENWQGN